MNLKSILNIDKNKLQNMLNFYKQLIKDWISEKGGNTKYPKRFFEIRKQVLWGNDNIRFNRKCLNFDDWINSDIITINYIIDEQGKISETTILSKLKYKQNWINQIYMLKKAIPMNWKLILCTAESIKTKVKVVNDLKIRYTTITQL